MDVQEIIENVFGDDYNVKTAGVQSLSTNMENVYDSERDMRIIDELNTWLRVFLKQNSSARSEPHPDIRDGRIGPALVRFDTTAHSGLFMISPDRLNVQSQSNFASIKANACVFAGKWQFEVQLGTKGVMQVGWCTAKCRFSQDAGVGDTVNSYAFDGNRVRKWNVATMKYGQPWLSGDIIGCCADMDNGTIHFIRNGEHMGIAFDHIRLGPGISFFPAVSLAYNDHLYANFGGMPLRYPEDSFRPLQEPPRGDIVKANLLLKYLVRLITVSEQIQTSSGSSTHTPLLSNDAVILRLCSVIMEALAPLLTNSYIVADCLMPCLSTVSKFKTVGNSSKNKSAVSTNNNNRKLSTVFDIFWSFCEDFEIEKCIDHIFQNLLSFYKQVSRSLSFEQQKNSLSLLCEILKHEQTRKFLLGTLLFRKVGFANFMHLKPVDEKCFAEIIPDVWWQSVNGDVDRDKNKRNYMEAVNRIREATMPLEDMQIEMLLILLNNGDGSRTEPSSRKIFLTRFRRYAHEQLMNSKVLMSRVKSVSSQTPPPVSLCTFHRLLTALCKLWALEDEDEDKVKKHNSQPKLVAKLFYDGSIEYFGIDRLGGVLSHIKKAFRAELVANLGEEHAAFTPERTATHDTEFDDLNLMDAALGLFLAGPSGQGMQTVGGPPVFPALARAMNQPNAQMLLSRLAHGSNNPRGFGGPVSPGSLDSKQSRYEFLDGIILYYHALAHKQLTKIGDMRDNQVELVTSLKDARDRIQYLNQQNRKLKLANVSKKSDPGPSIVEQTTEVVQILQTSESVFVKRLEELSRQLAWARALIVSPARRRDFAILLAVVLGVLQDAATSGQLFAFVPDFYIEALCQLTTAVRDIGHPVPPKAKDLDEHITLIEGVAAWLCTYFSDTRVILAGAKDSLVQGLGSLAMCPTSLHAMERVPLDSRIFMVKALLRPYENRAWAQSNWLLVRFWQGRGFAFREARAPQGFMGPTPRPSPTMSDTGLLHRYCDPCPSEVFQNHVGELLRHEALATAFINSVLNQLNWAFSEFIGMLQEIQNISLRPERVYIESRQLKICATCFELTVSLLRVVEMVTYVAPHVFLDPSLPASDLLLSRLLQLICQILNRISSTSGCFQHAVGLSLPDLGVVGHFSVLAACIGVLLGLLEPEILRKDVTLPQVPRVCRALLTEPSFQLSSIKFSLGEVSNQPLPDSSIEIFSFTNYPNSVTVAELGQIRKIINGLEVYQSLLSASTILGDDIACPICYARPLSATFSPCGHRSCAACIAHHLMNSRKCFFCMAKIEKVYDFQGATLHVLPAS